MANSHAARMNKVLEKIEITAVVDIDLDRAQMVAELFTNKPVVHKNYEEILDHVDATLVVLPHHLHHPVTIKCLNEGKHVLVEKPMAATLEQASRMLTASARKAPSAESGRSHGAAGTQGRTS